MNDELLDKMCKAYESIRGEVCHVRSMEAAVEVVMPYIEQSQEEIKRLQKYEKLVQFIANDYYEMSHDKVKWQHNDWYKRCRKLIEEDQ